MSTLTVKRDKKGNVESAIIEGGTFYYAHLKTPTSIYNDRKLPYKEARKEYAVDVAVTEDVADEWDEIFAKQLSKSIKNDKFIEKYKLDEDNPQLPFPDEKKQYIIKITQKAQYEDGEPIKEGLIPRVKMVLDGVAKDITFTTLIGNGSTGKALVNCSVNDFGTFAYLYRMQVKDLIEYEVTDNVEKDFFGVDEIEQAAAPERKAAGEGDEEDDGEGDDKDGGEDKAPEKPAKKSTSKKTPKTPDPEPEDGVDPDDF